MLQAAHISDDEYFSHMVLDDLNLIIRDIRETHKKDSESAPQTTVANELKENLEAVENFKGSRLEKLAVLYCKQLGINYKNLSDEEFRWLIRILQKSKKTGTQLIFRDLSLCPAEFPKAKPTKELSKLTGISKSALGRLLWGFRRLSAVPDREQGADQHATDGAAFER